MRLVASSSLMFLNSAGIGAVDQIAGPVLALDPDCRMALVDLRTDRLDRADEHQLPAGVDFNLRAGTKLEDCRRRGKRECRDRPSAVKEAGRERAAKVLEVERHLGSGPGVVPGALYSEAQADLLHGHPSYGLSASTRPAGNRAG